MDLRGGQQTRQIRARDGHFCLAPFTPTVLIVIDEQSREMGRTYEIGIGDMSAVAGAKQEFAGGELVEQLANIPEEFIECLRSSRTAERFHGGAGACVPFRAGLGSGGE